MKLLIVLAVCVAVASAGHLQRRKVGGTGALMSAKDNQLVSQLVEQVKPELERASGKSVAKLEPISYKTQVVAGRNYFVKAKLTEQNGHSSYVHLAIYEPLTRSLVKLSAYKMDVDQNAELQYFH